MLAAIRSRGTMHSYARYAVRFLHFSEAHGYLACPAIAPRFLAHLVTQRDYVGGTLLGAWCGTRWCLQALGWEIPAGVARDCNDLARGIDYVAGATGDRKRRASVIPASVIFRAARNTYIAGTPQEVLVFEAFVWGIFGGTRVASELLPVNMRDVSMERTASGDVFSFAPVRKTTGARDRPAEVRLPAQPGATIDSHPLDPSLWAKRTAPLYASLMRSIGHR